MKWYNKFDKTTGSGSLNCPHCNHSYQLEMFYAIEPRACVECNHSLMIINIHGESKYVYTIDIETAPAVFKSIIDHLSALNNKEAYHELKELVLLFKES